MVCRLSIRLAPACAVCEKLTVCPTADCDPYQRFKSTGRVLSSFEFRRTDANNFYDLPADSRTVCPIRYNIAFVVHYETRVSRNSQRKRLDIRSTGTDKNVFFERRPKTKVGYKGFVTS